jgi:hypothetical protein
VSRHLRRWGAAYVLLALFLGSWFGQLVTQVRVEQNEAAEHGETFVWSDFWYQFFASTFENWQSEFLQLFVQGVLLLGPLMYVLWQADENADKSDVKRLEDKLDRILDQR